MNETKNSKNLAVKILVIIGFIVTIILFIWLAMVGIKQLSPSFASLANVIDSMRDYKPVTELVVTVEKNVVNSGESFQIFWTDMKQGGEFKLTYQCKDGITIFVQKEDGEQSPIQCTETLSLPATVQNLSLSIEDSSTSQLTNVELSLAFVSSQKDITKVDGTKITVVNTSIPAEQEVAGETTEERGSLVEMEDEVSEAPQTSIIKPVTQPITYTTVYPQSNPNGYIDIDVKTIGTGEVRNGIFAFTGSLDSDNRNAIKFDIQNIGTKTSNAWSFEITLPDGVLYKSNAQIPLKPKEHAEFVLEFNIDNDDDFVRITVESETTLDYNSKNNTSVWHAAVDN